MFEAVELGRQESKATFKTKERQIRGELLKIQRQLREAGRPVVIIVAGVEGGGKGELMNRLNKWLDTRGLQTHAFWDDTDEERERPGHWRFWRCLPPRGEIAMMFGAWYHDPITRRVLDQISEAELDQEMLRINQLEQMLIGDGVLIVKIWLHLSRGVQPKRLKKRLKAPKPAPIRRREKKLAARYDVFVDVAERVIRLTDTMESQWHVIEADDKRYRDLTAGQVLLSVLQAALQEHRRGDRRAVIHHLAAPVGTDNDASVLDRLDLSLALDPDEYRKQLSFYQRRLNELAWSAYDQKHSLVAVLEGWDAAGKGGTIRRLTAAVDARLYRVISIGAPTDEELAHHYLWRFWRHLPRAGYMTIYDRSWYGRVLVERVEELAEPFEWMRAYREINNFEEQLTEHGVMVAKFWIHISQDEQLARFRARESIAWKQYKISDEDWRNRGKWDTYVQAVNNVIEHTSTANAPWTLIAGNDKKYARIQVLKTLCERLEASVGSGTMEV